MKKFFTKRIFMAGLLLLPGLLLAGCDDSGGDDGVTYPYSYLIVANADTDEINAINITLNGVGPANALPSSVTVGLMEYWLGYETSEMTLDVNVTTADGDSATYTGQVVSINKALVIKQEADVFTCEVMNAADAVEEGFDLSISRNVEKEDGIHLIKTTGIRSLSR